MPVSAYILLFRAAGQDTTYYLRSQGDTLRAIRFRRIQEIMPIRFDKKNKCWRFEFNRIVGNKRVRASKLLPEAWSEDQAHAYDRQESGHIYAVSSGLEKPKPLIEESVNIYVTHHLPRLKNGKKAGQDLYLLYPYIEGRHLDELGKIARQYQKDNPHLAPATIRNRLSYLRAAVRYAYRQHDIGDRDYTDKMVMPAVRNKRQVYINQYDMEHRLLANCDDPETSALIKLAFFTGLRWRSEILTLKPEQVVTANGQAWITIPDSKNGTPHMIPIHPDAMDAMQFIPFRFEATYYYKRFWKARKAAGLDHLRLHDERHSLASALLSSGATLGEVGRVLNHDSVQSTERYSHLYPERVKELILRLPSTKKSAPLK
jgi:integrase